MIHELRNPLNAVLGSIGLLKYSKSLSKEDLETLNIASVSGEILITFINNALDGAKLEANKLELDYHMNDVVETMTKAVSLFAWKAKEKKVNISLMIGKNMPTLVEIDEARLTQVLVNLIGNAVKFTPGNGNVKVRARFIPNEDAIKERLQQNQANETAANETEESKCRKLLKSQRFQHQASFLKPKYFSDILANNEQESNDFENKYFYHKDITNNEIQVSEDLQQLLTEEN
jgi:signal transduction histidine kinase